MSKRATYTGKDAGCYVDGARGIYSTDAIVDFARSHGATIEHECPEGEHSDTMDESEFAGCEFADEYEEEAANYMNEKYPVDGHTWGRNENGDWGLWSDDEEGDGEEEEEEEEEEPQPQEGDYTITPTGPLGSRSGVGQIGGKYLGDFPDDAAALAFIQEHMEREKFYPNIWLVSDHGNWELYTG